MLSFSHQRVAVFIDTANLYHTAKHVFGGRVQFQSLLETAERGRALVRALAYTVSTEGEQERNFTDTLRGLGIEIRSKELITYKNGDQKADWDVGIAIDAISIAPHVDVVVLASGDGDFVPLVKHLREQGVRVEVMAFDQSISQSLIDVADEYINMSDSPDQYVFVVRQYGRDNRIKTRDIPPAHKATAGHSRPMQNVRSTVIADASRALPVSRHITPVSVNGRTPQQSSTTQYLNTPTQTPQTQMKHGMIYITPESTATTAVKSEKIINSKRPNTRTTSTPKSVPVRSTNKQPKNIQKKSK